MAEQSPWQRYLASATQATTSVSDSRQPFIGVSLTPAQAGPRDEVLEEQQRGLVGRLGAAALGVPAQIGEQAKGFVSNAAWALGLISRVGLSSAKEIGDALWQVSNKVDSSRAKGVYGQLEREAESRGLNYNPSLSEWYNQIKEEKYAQDILPELYYDPKTASKAEKIIKEAAGLGIDIQAGGGFTGGVKLTGLLGRKRTAELIDQQAQAVFRKYLPRAEGITDDAYKAAADEFATGAVAAQLTGRSRGLREYLQDQLTLETGRKAFFEDFSKELQGGLRLVSSIPLFGRGTLAQKLAIEPNVVAQLNAGGDLTQKVLTRLGLGKIADTPYKAVQTYQGVLNKLRTGSAELPGVAAASRGISAVLNQIGRESAGWGSFLNAVVRDVDREDLNTVFRSYQARQDVYAMRDTQVSMAQDATELIKDAGKLATNRPEVYKRFDELAGNPELAQQVAKQADLDEVDTAALQMLDRHTKIYDDFYRLMVESGADVGYQDQYIPLLYVAREKQDEFLKGLSEGYKNLPGRGLDFTKERTAFMKQVTDEAGNTVEKAMTPREIKAKLTSMGLKDLADEIEDDPLKLLMQYTTNVTRQIAMRGLIRSLRNKGVLFRTDIAQLDVDADKLESALSKVSSPELEKIFGDFVGTPGAIAKYFDGLNDELVQAYNSKDPAAIKMVEAKVNEFMTAVSMARNEFRSKVLTRNRQMIEKAAQAGDTAKMEALLKNKDLLQSERQYLSELLAATRSTLGGYVESTGQRDIRKMLGETIDTAGVQYQPVGAGQQLTRAFYLPKELEMLAGEKSLVDAIERAFLMREPKFQGELGQAVDSYMNFFRAAATFGKLSGFVLRNGYSAVQTNIIIAGAKATDFDAARKIVPTLLLTERGLQPFTALRSTDVAQRRLEKMAADGGLTAEQAARMRKDLETFGAVQAPTLREIQEEVIAKKLKAVDLGEGLNGYDVYLTAKEGGIFDDYVILQGTPNVDLQDDSVKLLLADPERFTINVKKTGKERGVVQRGLEGLLNIGFEVDVALGANRRIKIRPIQNTRDLNQTMEYFNRMVPIVAGLRKFGNTAEGKQNAVMLMKAAQYDYSNLTDFERNVVRRFMMPFWTWSKNNVPAMARAVFNDPQRVANNLRGWDFVREVFSDENGDVYILPDYVTEMMGFVVDDKTRQQLLEDKPYWLDAILGETGGQVLDALLAHPIAFRPESPIFDLEKLTAGGPSENFQEVLSGTNPLVKGLAQLAFQKNLFSGKNYDSSRGVKAPFYIEKIVRAAQALDPRLTLGTMTDPETGDIMIDEGGYDFIRGIIPILGSGERVALPLIEVMLEAATGEQQDLAGKQGDRALSNLLSTIAGVNLVTITPETEISTLKDQKRRIDAAVRQIAAQQQISQVKLNEFIGNVLGENPNIDIETLSELIETARQDGLLEPDYLSAPEQ